MTGNNLAELSDNDVDRDADTAINACLQLDGLRSFFLFAGAGSGKTRSLVEALKKIRKDSSRQLIVRGQRVAVITYTNTARDEIKRRLDFDPLFEVSTIHSFVWTLIGTLHSDIKRWVSENLTAEIAELEEKQRRGRTSQASTDRAASIASKQRRLEGLPSVKCFTYNPNGENRGRDSLSHTEVIKIGADFLTKRPLMQVLLVSRFPILLIDESQDTNKLLMEAFLAVQAQQKHRFALGLLGDTMQRIYADGMEDLGKNVPDDWAKPVKNMNHRCPQRVIRLINRIRSYVDAQEQQGRRDKEEGFVRLFILPSGGSDGDKQLIEKNAAQRMAEITGDPLWSEGQAVVKTLILEHLMAARRLGFMEMYSSLYAEESLRIGLLDGSLPGLRFFTNLILPLVRAAQKGDKFAVAAVVRGASPLVGKAVLSAATDQADQVARAKRATDDLMKLWSGNATPRFLDVLRSVVKSGLFEIPESLGVIAFRSEDEDALIQAVADVVPAVGEVPDKRLEAWEKFMLTPFSQLEPYVDYVAGKAAFDTHQGVKGLEFPRVMVIMDDGEMRGFLFGYDKLFGAKAKTDTDLKNEKEGKDTMINRTRRLLYVTCSRAEKSLALIAYSGDPAKVRDFVVNEQWFAANEVELVA